MRCQLLWFLLDWILWLALAMLVGRQAWTSLASPLKFWPSDPVKMMSTMASV